MSTLSDTLPQLLAEQRADGETFDRLLRESNRALAAGDLATANRQGDLAQSVMVRIRMRSAHMADLLDQVEQRLNSV